MSGGRHSHGGSWRTHWRTAAGQRRETSRWGSYLATALFSDGETVRGYALDAGARQSGRDIDEQATGNDYAAGLWSDGETLWVVDEYAQKAYAYAAPGLRKPAKRTWWALTSWRRWWWWTPAARGWRT